MAKPQVLVLRTAGTNCDKEAVRAFELAGGQVESLHINRLVEQADLLDQFQILTIPGGFSYGDDIAAGRIMANQILHHLRERAQAFVDAGKLVIGICNGFQVLVKAGLLPGLSDPSTNGTQQATITYNDSGKFEDRWVWLEPGTDQCVFITPGRRLYLPVAHGEGKVCFANPNMQQHVCEDKGIAFRYVDAEGSFGGYPVNPNGSVDHIAGLCDPTGRVFGLMPHPERFVHCTQHPRWTREKIEDPDGLTIFRNAVNYFS